MKGRAAGVAYLDFSEAFDTASCSVLAAKLVRSGLDKWTIRWVEIWLDRWAPKGGDQQYKVQLAAGCWWHASGVNTAAKTVNGFIYNVDNLTVCALNTSLPA